MSTTRSLHPNASTETPTGFPPTPVAHRPTAPRTPQPAARKRFGSSTRNATLISQGPRPSMKSKAVHAMRPPVPAAWFCDLISQP